MSSLPKIKYKNETLIKKDYIFVAVNKGMSYEAIGKELGISKQRVHQIYKDYRTHYPDRVNEFLKILREKPCDLCGSTKNIHIHHKDGNREHNGVDNLMILCNSCHGKIHNKVNTMSPGFKKQIYEDSKRSFMRDIYKKYHISKKVLQQIINEFESK